MFGSLSVDGDMFIGFAFVKKDPGLIIATVSVQTVYADAHKIMLLRSWPMHWQIVSSGTEMRLPILFLDFLPSCVLL
jgi:hypothetical protein